jgi:ATP-dependent RNA/DNA helicase IGHMBP2
MRDTIEELKRLQATLKIEQEEDRQYYRDKVLRSPLKERKEKGICWYPVNITEEGSSLGGKMYVEVERLSQIDENHQFQFGKVASLFNNNSGPKKDNPFLSGIITAVRPNKLKISFNVEELPDWVEDGKLGVDLLFDEVSYREMNSALTKVIGAEYGRLAELREVLLGKVPARFTPPLEFHDDPELNASQNEALLKIASAEDTAIIHGPPGTGKTTTLVEAIILTLQAEKQVLVCAPSNTAIDLITE